MADDRHGTARHTPFNSPAQPAPPSSPPHLPLPTCAHSSTTSTLSLLTLLTRARYHLLLRCAVLHCLVYTHTPRRGRQARESGRKVCGRRNGPELKGLLLARSVPALSGNGILRAAASRSWSWSWSWLLHSTLVLQARASPRSLLMLLLTAARRLIVCSSATSHGLYHVCIPQTSDRQTPGTPTDSSWLLLPPTPSLPAHMGQID